MGFFYDRQEKQDQILFSFKRCAWLAIFYWVLFVINIVYVIIVLESRKPLFLIPAAVILIAWRILNIILFRNPNKEIKCAMKEGRLTISGSNYSFSNPLTCIIDKKRSASNDILETGTSRMDKM